MALHQSVPALQAVKTAKHAFVAKTKPEGYTLLFTPNTMATAPLVLKPGSGSPMHILGEMFNQSAGIKLTQVSYRGSGPAIIDLIGDQVPMMYTTLGPVAQHIASGKLVNIGVADAQRSPLAPNVPTLAEAGLKDDEPRR